MRLYVPGHDTDALVAIWWETMAQDGDLDDLFFGASRTLSGLFRLIQPPGAMLYEIDAKGIWFAMWFEGMLSGAAAGAWVRTERRRTKACLDAFLAAWEQALIAFPVILGVTRQEKLLREHTRLGYTVLGEVPELWEGRSAWVVVLTRPAFVRTLARFGRISQALDALVGQEVPSDGRGRR